MFTTSNGEKDYHYRIDSIITLTPDTYYDRNNTIPAYYIDSAIKYFGSNNGLFSISVSNNLDDTCDDNYVKFEVSTTEPLSVYSPLLRRDYIRGYVHQRNVTGQLCKQFISGEKRRFNRLFGSLCWRCSGCCYIRRVLGRLPNWHPDRGYNVVDD